MNLLNVFFIRKSKHAIKGERLEIGKKQNKLTCESNSSEKYE